MSKKINIKFSKELKIVNLSSEMLYNIEEVKDRADKQLKEKIIMVNAISSKVQSYINKGFKLVKEWGTGKHHIQLYAYKDQFVKYVEYYDVCIEIR